MVRVKLLCTAILFQVNVLISGLNLNELHGDVFPSHQESKRQYVYGRVLPSSRSDDIINSETENKPFQMDTMFSSAMGNKLKRLVSHIDNKMKTSADSRDNDYKNGGQNIKKDVKNDNIMMSGNQKLGHFPNRHSAVPNLGGEVTKRDQMYNTDREGKSFSDHYRPSRRIAEDKRFVGLHQQPLGSLSSAQEEDELEPKEEVEENQYEMEPVWLNKQSPIKISSRIPPGIRRRTIPMVSNFRSRKEDFERKASGDWYDAEKFQNSKKDTVMGNQMMHKKDDEVVDDYNFFKDENEVINQLKRIFVEDDEAEATKNENKDEENSQKDDEDEENIAGKRHKELIDEYIKHMAQVMTVKKRSPMSWRQKEELHEYRQAEKMDDRLRRIEDMILDEANEIMEEDDDDDQAEYMVMSRVNAAKDLETIRKSLMDLEKVMYQIRREDPSVEQFMLTKRGNQLANALGVTAPSDRRRRFDPSLSRRDLMADSENSMQIDDDQDECMEDEAMYGKDCSLLTNFLPDGDYKGYFRDACNDHQLCYTCMDVFGSSATECDAGFVRATSTICKDNKPCNTATKTMVLSNRRKRTTQVQTSRRCALKLCLGDDRARRRRRKR